MTATAAPTTIVTTFTTSAPTPIEAEAAAILADYRLARDAEVAAKAAKQAAAAAQASVEKATAVAVENVDKGTKAAASALKVA